MERTKFVTGLAVRVGIAYTTDEWQKLVELLRKPAGHERQLKAWAADISRRVTNVTVTKILSA